MATAQQLADAAWRVVGTCCHKTRALTLVAVRGMQEEEEVVKDPTKFVGMLVS